MLSTTYAAVVVLTNREQIQDYFTCKFPQELMNWTIQLCGQILIKNSLNPEKSRWVKIQCRNMTENKMVQRTTVFLEGLAIQPWRRVQERQRKKMQKTKQTVTTHLKSNFETHTQRERDAHWMQGWWESESFTLVQEKNKNKQKTIICGI